MRTLWHASSALPHHVLHGKLTGSGVLVGECATHCCMTNGIRNSREADNEVQTSMPGHSKCIAQQLGSHAECGDKYALTRTAQHHGLARVGAAPCCDAGLAAAVQAYMHSMPNGNSA
jgi:hypothetical protein